MRRRGAFAHRDEDLAVADSFRNLLLGREVALQRPHFDIPSEGRPVRHGQRDILVVVEYGTVQRHGSGAYLVSTLRTWTWW